MRITKQPTTVYVAGEVFSPALEVTYFDESGNIDPLANRPVTASLEHNPTNAVLGVTLSSEPAVGVTLFDDLKMTKAGNGYTIKFTNADGLTETSTPFEIVAAVPARMDVTSAPLTINANECSASAVVYDVVDQFGNTTALTQDTIINLAGSNLQFFADAACTTPITSQNLVAGTQSSLFFVSGTVAGSHAMNVGGGILGADSQVITINAAAAGKLAILGTGQTLVAGTCSAAAVIQSRDLFNNPNAVSADTTISLAGTGMTFYQDATCSGAPVTQLTMPTGTGNVTFYFSGTTAGAITITGSAPTYTSGTQVETILSSTVTSLAFRVQPSDTVAGAVMTPAVEVSLLDQYGNIANSSVKTITLAISNNPSGTAVIVGGNRSKATVNGIAVFSAPQEIVIQKADTGYTLVATAAGLVGVVSDPFDILGDKITTLEYSTASQNLEAGECSSVVTVVGKDQFGNPARASADTVLNLAGTGLTFYSDNTCSTSIPSVTIGTGLNSVNFHFIGTVAGNPIAKTASVTLGDAASAITQNHVISPAAPQSVSFISAVQTTEAGVCSDRVEIKVGDIYGNPVPPVANANLALSASDGVTVFYSTANCAPGSEITNVTLASGANYGSFYYLTTKSGSNTVTVNGNADFGSGNIPVTGSQVNTVLASDPDHLEFLTQPAASTLAGTAITPAVQVGVKDIYGNLCESYATTITLDIQDNPPTTGALTGGAKSVVPVAGVATYSGANDLIIHKAANGYSFGASSGALTAIESSSFNIVPAPATKYRYAALPGNVKAGYCSASAVAIQTEDAFGNISPVSSMTAVTYGAAPTGTGALQFFSDDQCSVPAATSIAAGASSLQFYFKGTIAGINSMIVLPGSIVCDAGMGCATSNAQSLTISPDEPYALAFATPNLVSPNQVEAGACSPAISLKTVDQFGNTVDATVNQVVELTPSSGGMFSDAACTDPIDNGVDPLTIAAGTSQASFYFMTTVTAGGQHTSTAESDFNGTFAGGTASPHNSIVAQVNAMKAAPPHRFHILQEPTNSIAGQPIAGFFRAEIRDKFGNPTLSATRTFINIETFSTTRPTLYGTGLTPGPNTDSNPVGKSYFPATPVQALWTNAVLGELHFKDALALNIQLAGTYTLRLSALGITYDNSVAGRSESVAFTVTNAPASKLAFTSGAHTLTAGACSGYVTVQSQDPYSNVAALGTDTTLTPSGTDMTFYSSAGCGAGDVVTNLTIPNGGNSATFYFRGTKSGVQGLTVQATAGATLTQATQNQTINPDVPVSLAYFTPDRTFAAGACSPVITVNSRDQFNNNSPLNSAATIAFSQSGTATGVKYYSDATCVTEITSLGMAQGSYVSSFYARGTVMGSVNIVVTPSFNAGGAANQTEIITAAALAQIEFDAPQNLTAGVCSGLVSFQLKDTYGNLKDGAGADVRFNTSEAGYLFYSDPTCTTSIDPSVGISVDSPATGGSFYFKGTIAGDKIMRGNVASPAVTGSVTHHIDPANFSRFSFVEGGSTITAKTVVAGACTLLTVEAQDEFYNIIGSNLGSQRVLLVGSTPNTQFYSAEGCNSGDLLPLTDGSDGSVVGKQFAMITGAKSVQVYISNTVKEVTALTAAHHTVTSAGNLNLTVNAAANAKLAFAPILEQSVAGQPLVATGPTSVKVNIMDQYNNITTSTATVVVGMYSGNANNTAVVLNGTKSVAAVAGTASFPTINITKSGINYSLEATSGTLTAAVSNLFDVVAAGPTQLSISSGAQTVVAGVCSGLSVATLLDQYGNPALASGGGIAIDLSGSGMTFYSDAGCGTPLPGSQLVIADGQTSGNFYYLPTESGSVAVVAERTTAPVLTAGSQPQTILPGPPVKIGFGTAVRSDIIAGVCAGAGRVVEVELQDTYGNRTANDTGSILTVDFTGLGAQTQLYLDSTCATEYGKSGPNYQTSIPVGGEYFSVYIKDAEAHTFPLTVTVAGQLWSDLQNETVIANVPNKLAYTSAAKTGIVAGTCSTAMTFQVQDINGNPSAVPATKTISLASDVSVAYYSDSGCSTPISSVDINTGTHSGTFYIRTTLAGSHDITISSTGLNADTQTADVTFDVINKLGFSQQPVNTPAGVTISPAVRVDALDQWGNIVTTFNGNIDIQKDAVPAGGTLSGTLSISAVNGRALFADLSIEKANTGYTLIATSAGLIDAASNSFNIGSNSPVDLYFVSSAQTLDVKNCSAITTMGLKDAYGNETTTAAGVTVSLVGDGMDFFSDSSCSNAITSSQIPAGQGQTNFWFKPSKAGNIVVNGSSAGLVTANQTETVIPGIPAKLAIVSDPQTVRSGECSDAVELQAQDAYGNETLAVTNISANLLGGNYVFYSDASCTTIASNLTIGVGDSTGQFWFKGSSLGTSTVMAQAAGLAPNATQDQVIVTGFAAQFVFTSAAENILTDECSSLATFKVQDINGNDTKVEGPVSVDLTSTGGIRFYADDTCATEITSVGLTPAAGPAPTVGSFYFKTGSIAGPQSTTVSVINDSSVDADRFKHPGAPATLIHNATARPPSQLSMLGNGQTFRVSTCSAAVTVQTRDSAGNVSAVIAPTAVSLSASHSVNFYSDSNCLNQIPGSTLNMGGGQTAVTFYFKSFVSSTITVTASANVEGTPASDSDPFIISPAAASKLVFTATPVDFNPAIKVDGCWGVYSTELRDRFDNVAVADVDYDLVLSSVNATYYSDANCTEEIVSYPPLRDRILQIKAGETGLAPFYMKTLLTGADNTVLSSNAGLENAFHTFIAFPAVASRLAYVTQPKAVKAGECSEFVEIKTTDHLGYETGTLGGLDVDLSLVPAPSPADISAGKYGIYSDAGCSIPFSVLNIPDGSTRGRFYFRSEVAGTLNIQIDATDTISDPDIIFPPVLQAERIEPNKPVRYGFVTAPTLVKTNFCSSAFTGDFYDAYGNVVGMGQNGNATFSKSVGDLSFYTDKDCTNQILGDASVTNRKEFFIKKATPGSVTIGVYSKYLHTTTNHTLEVTDADIDKVEIITATHRVGYDFCSPMTTVQLQQPNGTPKVADVGGVEVGLSAKNTLFYSSAACDAASAINKVTIASGASTASFYFKLFENMYMQTFPKTIHTNQINLNSDGLAGGSQLYQVLHFDSARPSTNFSVPSTVLLGACVQVDSRYSNANFAYAMDMTVTGSGNMGIYSDASCTTLATYPTTLPDDGVLGDSVLAPLYIKATTPGAAWYEFSEPHLNNGRINVDVKELQIRVGGTAGINVIAGTCTPVAVESFDHLGAPWDVAGADLVVPLVLHAPPLSNGSFFVRMYSDDQCSVPSNGTTIPVGQRSKTVYLKTTVAPDFGYVRTEITNSKFANITKSINVVPGAPARLVLDTPFIDSVIMGQCSPVMQFRSVDSSGNISNLSAATNINLSAQEVDIYGYPAGVGSPKAGVNFFTDPGCSNPTTTAVINGGESLSTEFYIKTNFGREQFALIADSAFASTYLIMSSAIDRLAFSGLPTVPSEDVYECRPFTIRHEAISDGNAIDPEKTIRYTVSSIGNLNSSGVRLPHEHMMFYRTADCSGTGITSISDTIVPLTGSPTQAEVEANVTRTYYLMSKSLAQIQVRVASPGRASSEILVRSTPPVGSKIAFREGLPAIEAGVCSGAERYVTRPLNDNPPIYHGRVEVGLRTSDASGSRVIYGGNNSSVGLQSGNIKFYSDTNCSSEITSIGIAAHKDLSAAFFFKSTKAGPNEASAVGQVTTDIAGLTGRVFYTVTPGPVYQIGFGSDPQTIRAGECSESLILQVQDRYGNEQIDTLENEVSFVYPDGFTLYSNNTCTNSIATTFVAAGQSRKSVWFRHIYDELATISSLPIRQLESVPQTQTILAGDAASLNFITAAKTVPKGICSDAITIQVKSFGGTPVNVTADKTVNLTGESGSGMVFYSSPDCSQASEITSLTIENGTNSKDFYFMSFKQGANLITAKNVEFVDAKQTQNIVTGLPVKMAFSSAARSVLAGVCSNAIEVFVADQYGTQSAAAANTILTLAGDSTTFYSDRFCTAPISTINLSAGDQTKTFYYKRTRSGEFDLSVSDTAMGTLGPAVRVESVRPMIMSGTKILTDPVTIPVGRCSPLAKVGVIDQYGNETKVTERSSLLLTMSGPGIQFYTDDQCSALLPGSQVNLSENSDGKEFYFMSTQVGNRTISIDNNRSLDPATQVETFTSGAASRLGFLTPVRTVAAGSCSQIITIRTLDDYNFETNAGQNYSIALTPPAGGQFYSSATCADGAEISAATISVGTSRADVYLKAPGTLGTLSIAVGAVGLASGNQNVTVTGGGPAQLVFNSVPQSGIVVETCSSQVNFGFNDAFGNSSAAVGNVVVSLTSAGALFYSDAGCTTQITSLTVPNAQTTGRFYFKPTQVGSVLTDISSAGITGASQTQTSVPGAANKLVFSSAAQNFVAGTCRTATIQTQDSLNNPVTATANRTISLAASGSPTVFYSSGDCSGAPITSVTQVNGSNSATFSFMITSSGTSNFTGSASGLAQALQTQTITPAVPVKWAYATSARTVVAGACSLNVTVQSQDTYSNPSPLGSTTTVSLVGAPLSFYSDSSCVNAISSVDIAAGTHSGTFYFKTATSGLWDITSSGGSLAAGIQQQTVNSDVPSKLAYVNGPLTVTAGACSSLSMQFQDVYGNPSAVSSSKSVTYQTSGVPSGIYSDAGCTASISNQTVATGHSFTAYFSSNSSGLATVRISAAGVDLADQTESIQAGAPSKIAFVTSSLTVDSGQCSGVIGPVTVQVQDGLNNPSGLAGASSFVLSGTGYTFYSDAACTTTVSSLPMGAGAHTANLYFRKNAAGVANITVAMTGFTSINQSQTVNALAVSKLGMSTPTLTSPVGICTAVTVQTQDANGNAVVRGTATTANLTVMSGTLSIYSDSGCNTTTSSVNIPGGSASGPTIYVRSYTSGSALLRASDAGSVLGNGTQTVTISSGSISAIAYTTSTLSTVAGSCSGVMTVQARDSFGNPVSVGTAQTVNLTYTPAVAPVSDGMLFFSDATCSSQISSVTIQVGNSSANLYYKANRANAYTVRAERVGFTAINQTQNVVAAALNSVTVASGANQNALPAGNCSAMVQLAGRDVYGNAARPATDSVFNLSGTNLSFFSDAGCSAAITSVTILSSASSVNFYFKSIVVGTYTVSMTGPYSTTTSTTIVPAAPTVLEIVAPVTAIHSGACSTAFTVRTKDQYGHYSSLSSSQDIALSTTPSMGQLYSDFGCLTALSGSKVTVASGTSTSQQFYFRHDSVQSVSLSANLAGFTDGTASVNVTSTGPMINVYDHPAADHYPSGSLYDYGIASVDTERSFYVRNDGSSVSGVLSLQLNPDLVTPSGIGSDTMWALKTDMCSGQALNPGASCLVTVEFKSNSGTKPPGYIYYSNLRLQAAPVAAGAGTTDIRMSGIKN